MDKRSGSTIISQSNGNEMEERGHRAGMTLIVARKEAIPGLRAVCHGHPYPQGRRIHTTFPLEAIFGFMMLR